MRISVSGGRPVTSGRPSVVISSRRSPDHEHGSRAPVCVDVTLDTATDARVDVVDGDRLRVLFAADLKRYDTTLHSFLRTIQKSPWVSATSKPAF